MLFECCKQSSSDYMYVRPFIQRFFDYSTSKFEQILTGSKCELYSKSTKRKIDTILGKYLAKGDDVSIVFFADVDTDSSEDKQRNQSLIRFSKKYGSRSNIVWFNLDIEDVFLGTRVKKDKPKEAKNFLNSKKIEKIDVNRMKCCEALKVVHSSNIYNVITNLLPKKR